MSSVQIFDSPCYRIEVHKSINPRRPYALDHKERSGDRVCLVNIGWFESDRQAYRAMNHHAEHGTREEP